MLSWKKGQKSPSMGNLEVFPFHFEMTFYFGISLGMEILKVCQFKSAVIQLLLIHKINNFMSCFLIHRSLVLVYHYSNIIQSTFFFQERNKEERTYLKDRAENQDACFSTEVIYFVFFILLCLRKHCNKAIHPFAPKSGESCNKDPLQ